MTKAGDRERAVMANFAMLRGGAAAGNHGAAPTDREAVDDQRRDGRNEAGIHGQLTRQGRLDANAIDGVVTLGGSGGNRVTEPLSHATDAGLFLHEVRS